MEHASQRLLAECLNSEMDRFWTRFNIFAAVQIGALVGVINASEFLVENRIVVRFAFTIVIAFSITGAVAVLRGHDLQRALVLALAEIEQALPVEDRLFSLVTRHYRAPMFISNWLSSFFAVFCCFCWTAAWLWLEATGYALKVPPGS